MKRIALVMLVAVVFINTGCIRAYTRLNRYGVRGQIADQETGKPLPETKLRVTVDGRTKRTKTDDQGHFSVKPDYSTHLAMLGGPVLIGASGARIEVRVPGCDAVSIEARDDSRPWHSEEVEHHPSAPSEDDYFLIGIIMVKKN